MPFLATGRYRLERGTGTDEFGDDTDVAQQVTEHVLASVLEQSRNVYDPASDRIQVVRQTVGRFRAGTDVQAGDRVIDERDPSQRWVVVDQRKVANPAHLGDVVTTLTSNTTGG